MRSLREVLFCFLWFKAFSPPVCNNCWSVAADKTSDRYGSLSVCSVLPRATADEDAQREVQVRANLFARPSISSFLIRIVEKSAAGGRLYGHHYPTSPFSLVFHSLAPQHMAMLLLLPIWGVFSNGCPSLSHKPLAVACLIVSKMKINICSKETFLTIVNILRGRFGLQANRDLKSEFLSQDDFVGPLSLQKMLFGTDLTAIK